MIENPAPSASGIDAGKESRAARGLPIVPAFDGFRATAIFAVVLLHLVAVFITPSGEIGRILTYGPLPNAIDVLFIISGFVVFLPTVARGGRFGPVGAYAIRRAARLLPAYWLVIALIFVLILFWPASPGPAMPPAGDFLAHVFGIHVPVHLFDQGFALGLGIDGPLWTLSLEVVFYLLLPLIAVAYYRHPFIGLLIAMLITVGWKLGAQNVAAIADALGLAPAPERVAYTERAAVNQFPSYAVQFALGMTAAWLFVELPKRVRPALLERRAVWVQGASLLLFAFGAWRFGRYGIDSTVLAPTRARQDILLTLMIPLALTAFMLATAFAPRRLQLPFALPVARSLGDISYGVYLIHFPLILLYGAIVAEHLSGASSLLTSFWVAAPLLTALAIGYGYLSGRYLELPIRRWAHRFGYRGAERPTPGPAPAAPSTELR